MKGNWFQNNIFNILGLVGLVLGAYIAFGGRIIVLEQKALAQEKTMDSVVARLIRIETKLDDYIFNSN